MSRPRNPICQRCKIRPKVSGRHYCLECKREVALEWYHKKHPEAKRRDPAAAREPEKRRERRERFEQLEAWCSAEGIRELARRVK